MIKFFIRSGKTGLAIGGWGQLLIAGFFYQCFQLYPDRERIHVPV